MTLVIVNILNLNVFILVTFHKIENSAVLRFTGIPVKEK